MPQPLALRTLLNGLIDYAGLFPPAKLPMPPAAENFGRYARGLDAWALGRFICPATRLQELSQAAAALMPGTYATSGYREQTEGLEPWRISVLADAPLPRCLELIAKFNDHHAQEDRGLAFADALEMKVANVGEIDQAAKTIPDEVFPFFELPPEAITGDSRGFVAAMAGHAAGAKIRTGGVTADAFPAPEAIARFVVACAGADVPFKATAGLHHPIRAVYNLTYDPNPPRGTMHGFLNVFVAAAMAYIHRADANAIAGILEETDAGSFRFIEEGVRWKDLVLTTAQLAKAREAFCLSYGSCSFEEPIDDLKRLELL